MTCRFSNLYYEAIEWRNESPFKEWIKILPPNRMVPLDSYDRRSDFHKVANVVGETMKLHPHGDASIFAALVNLANKGAAEGLIKHF